MDKKTNTNRLEYLDLYRGIGIFAMVLGHIYIGALFDQFIHAFHMPMFFIVSGFFVSEKESFFKYSIHKIRKLMIPYFVCSFLIIGLYCIITKEALGQFVEHIFWINTEGMSIAGALWFLTAMFFATILYRLILFVKSLIAQTGLVVLFVAIGHLFPVFLTFRLPFALDVGLVSIGFMHIGHYMKVSNEKIKNRILSLNVWMYVLLLIVFGALSFANSYVNLREGLYGNIILFWINASGISFCLWMLCKKMHFPKAFNLLVNTISYAGHWSIVFLITNQTIIFLISRLIDNFEILSAHLYVKKIAIIIVTFVSIYIVTYIWNHIKYNCFGKKYV